MLVHGRCTHCGYLTLLEIAVKGKMARKRCTHCGHGYCTPWDDAERDAVERAEEHFAEMSVLYPALRRLRYPGDHVPPPEEEGRTRQ